MTSMTECVKPEAENIVANALNSRPAGRVGNSVRQWLASGSKTISRNDPLGEMHANIVIDRSTVSGRPQMASLL